MSKAQYLASPVSKQVIACRNCQSPRWSNVLSFGDQYIPAFTRERNPLAPQAPLELIRCDSCGLIQLKHSVNPELLWGENYWYRSGVNQTMRDALKDVVKEALNHKGTGTWLDIGANDGTLLSKVPDSFKRIACEPSKPFLTALEEHADQVINDFFSADHEGLIHNGTGLCDVITSCAMFYDLDDPNAFVADIKKVLARDGVWVNQLSSTEAMIRGNAFDNICFEHRLYLDVPTLTEIYARHGLTVVQVSFNDVNGGSMRIVAQHREDARVESPPIPKITEEALDAFAVRVKKWREIMRWLIDDLHASGRTIYGYAASTKACTLLQYLGRSDRIMAIADRNPAKEGMHMPGVWVPIVSEATMRKAKPDVLLGLAWAFKREMVEREADLLAGGTAMLWPLPEAAFTL